MCVYSGIALRAPREQLLARVDREIMGTILQLSRVTQRVGARAVQGQGHLGALIPAPWGRGVPRWTNSF